MASPELRLLDFKRRAALRIRLATAMAFRGEGLPGASKTSSDNQVAILSLLDAASKAARAGAKPPIKDAIHRALPDLDTVELNPIEPAGRVLAERLQAFRDFIGSFDCPYCTEPDSGKHNPPGGAWLCMAELYELFDQAVKVASISYRQVSDDPDLVWPGLFLETADIHAYYTTDVLDIAAVTGSCRYGTANGAPLSVVGLAVKDDAFCWTSMIQLPYVLMHELVCHAFQGLKGPERTPVDKTCAWSEGWMDAVAFAVTKEWIEGAFDVDLPGWARGAETFVDQAGGALHTRRREPQTEIGPETLEAREYAYNSLSDLKTFYRGENPDSTEARQFVRRFSLRLNLHVMTQEQRGEIADWIGLSLELHARSDEVMSACVHFIEHDNWEILYNKLKVLMN
jgi:hypothetical protein